MINDANLLESLSVAIGRPVTWRNVAVLRNVGGLRQGHVVADALETRGFHLLVLADHGRASHYVKVRNPSDLNAHREGRVLTALKLIPAAARLVPQAQVLVLPTLTALVLSAIRGPTIGRRMARASVGAAVSEARTCLTDRTLLLESARDCGALEPPPAHFEARESLEPALRVLEAGWVNPEVVRALRASMPSMTPASAQHGDLTAANIIWGEHGPVFLDFEYFGLINCPLYDTWHFIRNIRRERGEADDWMGMLAPRSREDAAWASLIEEEAAKLQLSREEIRASFLWYLAQFSARFIARGNPESYYRPYLTDLTKAARFVAR